MALEWNEWTQWNHIPPSPVIYEHSAIDLGAVISFVPQATYTGSGTPTITEKHSDDDVTYTNYAATGSLISARYFIIKVSVVETSYGAVMDNLVIVADATTQTEDFFDIDMSTLAGSTGNRTIVPAKTYSLITSVGIAIQNVGAGYSWEVISKAPSAIVIKVYDGSDILADATIDITIRGIAG